MQTNEHGSALVVALIVLVLLTLIGVSATTTSQIETQIAGNERTYMQDFYVADSSWKEGVGWLNNLVAPPTPINIANNDVTSGVTDLNTVGSGDVDHDIYNIRNYGDISGTVYDPSDPDDLPPLSAPDGSLGRPARASDYWYKVAFYPGPGESFNDVITGNTMDTSSRGGLGGGTQVEYDFQLTGNANDNQKIRVTVTKIFTLASASGY